MPGFRLSSEPIAPDALKESLRHNAAGALVTFEGWVRDHNEGRSVEQLAYEAFEVLAVSEGNRIIAEAIIRFGVLEAVCIHRTGLLAIGEPAVWVGVVAPHRDAAYQANRYIIDNIKTRLPIWKKEFYAGGEAEWVNCQQCANHAHPQAQGVAPISQTAASTAPASKHGLSSGKKTKAFASNPRAAQQKALQDAVQKPAPNVTGSPVKAVNLQPAVRDSKFANSSIAFRESSETVKPNPKTTTPTALPDAQRYIRQTLLPQVGVAGQQKLAGAKVLVVGAGGLGCAALQYLAAAGIGHLGICEADNVEASNLNRQVLFATNEIGQSKARTAAAKLKAANPRINIYLHEDRLTKASAARTIGPYDLILDCTDNFPSKFVINDTAVLLQKPVISASIYQYEGQVHLYRPTQTGCLRCLWPEAPRNGVLGNCEEAGVLGAAAGIFGTLQAMEALKLILELPTPLADSLLVMDLLHYDLRKLKREKLDTCQHGEDYLLERIGQAVQNVLQPETAQPIPVAPVKKAAVEVIAPEVLKPEKQPIYMPEKIARDQKTFAKHDIEVSATPQPTQSNPHFEAWAEEMLTPATEMSELEKQFAEEVPSIPRSQQKPVSPVDVIDEVELELMPWSPHRIADFTVLDIREAHERDAQLPLKKGAPLPAVQAEHLPYSRFDASRLQQGRTYLLLCQRGQYSTHLAAELRQQGFTNVYSLAGGVLRQDIDYLNEIHSLQEGMPSGRRR